MTISGGEPLIHAEYVSELLKAFKEEGIHTLIETSGQFDIEEIEALVLPYADSIYFDIKIIDTEAQNLIVHWRVDCRRLMNSHQTSGIKDVLKKHWKECKELFMQF